MVGMIIAGPLADLWGRKRGLILSLAMCCVVSVIHAVLPLSTSFAFLLVLRIFSGFAAALSIPTAITLAVESVPQNDRLRLIFGIQFMGSLGYLMEAIGVQWFMPHFGEDERDNWRGLCLFVGLPALISLPMVFVIWESPTFLAINGRWNECTASLDAIAWWNGRPRRQQAIPHRVSRIWRSLSFSETRGRTLQALAESYLSILLLLTLIDSARSFFVSGSAYLCKDLFELTRLNQSIPPTTLNIIASLSPLIGLMIGERFIAYGVRNIMMFCCIVAAAALFIVALDAVRTISWLLLLLVLIYKLTYGPTGTCISVMKVEAFPTEFRATAFAAICVVAKLLCALGPTLVEALKSEEAASSWDSRQLTVYIVSLAAFSLVAGILTHWVPITDDEGLALKDFSRLNIDSDSDGDANDAENKKIPEYGTLSSSQPQS